MSTTGTAMAKKSGITTKGQVAAQAKLSAGDEVVDPIPAENKRGKKQPQDLRSAPKKSSKTAQPAQPDASKATPWRGIDPATISKNPGATIEAHPDGQKFCKHHDTTHPATLEFFASNVTAKDGLFNICKLAEKEIRTPKQASAQAAPASNVVALPAAATPASAPAKKARK